MCTSYHMYHHMHHPSLFSDFTYIHDISWQLIHAINNSYMLILSHVIKANKQLGIREIEWWKRTSIVRITIGCAWRSWTSIVKKRVKTKIEIERIEFSSLCSDTNFKARFDNDQVRLEKISLERSCGTLNYLSNCSIINSIKVWIQKI